MKKTEKLAIHDGKPIKQTPFGRGTKHNLNEWKAIKPIFERGTIQMARGPEVMALREKFKRLFGMQYAVTASSGTAALHTAMGALEIGRGDEVITSPITDMGTLTAVLAQNAVPIFADVDSDTLMITPETIAARITPRTKAIILIHLAGLPADARGIMRLARKHNIDVVEDMAQSYLTKQAGRYCGTFGKIGCWSLNESKHIGAGDGGIMLTNSRELACRADLFADKCYDREGGPMDPFFAAYNYRLNTLVAGVCLEQLKKLRWVCSRRNKYGTRLDQGLAAIEGIQPRPVRKGDYATYWYYVFHIDPKILNCTNVEFAKALQAEGVGANAYHQNVVEWSLFREHRENRHACAEHCPLYDGGRPDYNIKNFPGLRKVKQRSIRVAMNEFWTPQDIRDIIRAIGKVADFFRRG
ncbi:MAG: DegT/DnrJ/EryC1/StrS family aminotransferase [Verrucomicrobia bacterium]|nr:DegT/DnrJ/EryC1/StrS family aminotransferase [Verrucomicrobiota bacterium]MBU1736415.1 DegT/DnrJ/EryC1/StrS family aminotransferase [Verrucomicrobiota bacterium]MBU1855665.1 DegT/DnrJ/EryC1/StrS family aminotransferase [Verrucomicrobiota bacterium]